MLPVLHTHSLSCCSCSAELQNTLLRAFVPPAVAAAVLDPTSGHTVHSSITAVRTSASCKAAARIPGGILAAREKSSGCDCDPYSKLVTSMI